MLVQWQGRDGGGGARGFHLGMGWGGSNWARALVGAVNRKNTDASLQWVQQKCYSLYD